MSPYGLLPTYCFLCLGDRVLEAVVTMGDGRKGLVCRGCLDRYTKPMRPIEPGNK